jgi:2-dehydropantoate 2-reductase
VAGPPHPVGLWHIEPVRFVVLGAGAIGGVVGGRLFQHGHDVTLVARGAHADALGHGLVLESPDETVTLPVGVVTEPAALSWDQETVVLLGVKSQDTDRALDQLSAVAPADIPVVCMQNGVENERRVLRRFPNTYGMCVMCPATYLRPGIVRAHSAPITGLLDLGRYPTGNDATGEAIAQALATSSFQSIPQPAIMRWKYRKLVMNLANSVEALCGPEGRSSRLADEAKREGERVLAAAGIEVASQAEDAERRGEHLQTRSTPSGAWSGGSTWQSLARGTGSVEVEYLNGEIALLAGLCGVDAPINRTLVELVRRAVVEGRPPGSWRIDEVSAMVDLPPAS